MAINDRIAAVGPADLSQPVVVGLTKARRVRLGWARVALVALTALVATACATRIIYNELDRLAVWWVDGYFDLDGEQERQLRQIVNQNLAWHRREQLPLYGRTMRGIAADLEGPMTAAQVQARYSEIEQLLDVLRERLSPDVTTFLRTMSDEQVEELFTEIEDENQEYVEEFVDLSPAERIENRQKIAERAARRIFGRLSPEQKSLIATQVASLEDVAVSSLEQRRAWQAAFKSALSRRNEPTFAATLERLGRNPESLGSSAHRRATEQNRAIVFRMTADLVTSLSDEQRDHARRRLGDITRDIELLIAASSPPMPASAVTSSQ